MQMEYRYLRMFFVVLLVGLSSALPSPMMSSEPGVPLPEYRVLSQKLNETGIEMCEDMLHLCPATADCCKKEDGKWDCCPKQAAIGADCCIQGFKRVCCIGNAPRCTWIGCFFG
ncbi:hypothetical protein CDAR_609931 [Caerostris darwini]|uniref:Granulins domain-containing protein n=1 Tax=Caerostris darwini TaxID=1538125 RepID=A0AAV4NIK2_9ARAC|nr:hypothetical protein CDAR_609931 [Caerostris darwini]